MAVGQAAGELAACSSALFHKIVEQIEILYTVPRVIETNRF
jgi:hypothetical protein